MVPTVSDWTSTPDPSSWSSRPSSLTSSFKANFKAVATNEDTLRSRAPSIFASVALAALHG